MNAVGMAIAEAHLAAVFNRPGHTIGALHRMVRMQDFESDALVIFGITGDLAYKKIIPAIENLVRRGRLDTPVPRWLCSGGPAEARAHESADPVDGAPHDQDSRT